MPSCYKIFEYWQYKRITEQGDVSDTDGLKVVDDSHFACCWACGMPVKREDILSWDKYDLSLKEVWADKRVNSKLNKCHILAKQFDGPNTPDNLFLMCEGCHIESPDTKNRAAFLRWVYRKKQVSGYGRNMRKMLDDGQAEICNRGYDWMEFLKKIDIHEISEIVEEGLAECGVHGAAISESSMVIAIVDAKEKRVIQRQ